MKSLREERDGGSGNRDKLGDDHHSNSRCQRLLFCIIPQCQIIMVHQSITTILFEENTNHILENDLMLFPLIQALLDSFV